MFRSAWKMLLIGAVAAAILAGGAMKADAFWRWGCRRPVVYSCTYTVPYYTASHCYAPCGYHLGYRPGPVRRLLFGRYRWHYGCWTTPAVSYGVYYSPVVVSEVALPGNAEPALPPATAPGFDFNPLEPTRPGSSYVPKPGNSGLISIWVPHDAKVIVNGHVTESRGSRRQFVSYGLQPGYRYNYEVRAQVIRDGKIIEDVRTVTLTAGQDVAVAFGFQSLPSQTLAAQW